jgi:hypothetical protein
MRQMREVVLASESYEGEQVWLVKHMTQDSKQ